MKRRTFCAFAAAAIGASAFPFGPAFTAVSAVTADVTAVTGDGTKILLRAADVEVFRAGLRGQLLLPGASGYEDARKIFNGMFDRRPALIVRCLGAADVVRGVRVDSNERLARAGGGALLGDIDCETLPFGLVTTTGTVSHTGVGGLTLGGGFGRVARRFGLTCDQLTSVDVVTADGQLLEASATENPDLFWAIRGGGGNFGIATSFEYRLHPFDGRAVGGHLAFPIDQARQALRGFGELFDRASDGLWIEPILTTTPGGGRALVMDVCLTEDLESADAILAPYRRLGKPLRDEVGAVHYVQLQTQDDERARIGGRYYTKSGFVRQISDDLADAMLEIIRSAPVPRARIALPPKGAAVDRIARDATAFWHRGALYNVLLQASGDDPAEDAANVGWARSQWPVLEKFTAGFYANTNLSEMPSARVREAYGGNYERLLSLKRKYDPTNLFRLNANIDPKATEVG